LGFRFDFASFDFGAFFLSLLRALVVLHASVALSGLSKDKREDSCKDLAKDGTERTRKASAAVHARSEELPAPDAVPAWMIGGIPNRKLKQKAARARCGINDSGDRAFSKAKMEGFICYSEEIFVLD